MHYVLGVDNKALGAGVGLELLLLLRGNRQIPCSDIGISRRLQSTQGGGHSFPLAAHGFRCRTSSQFWSQFCRISASPIFLKFVGLVEPSHKSLNLKSRRWRRYGFMGNLKDVLDYSSS